MAKASNPIKQLVNLTSGVKSVSTFNPASSSISSSASILKKR